MSKLLSFQFYPADWRADAVFSCSLAARGLWHEMMMMAHVSERRGYLCQNGLPIPDEAIARYCGCTLQEYQTLLAELERAGVPRRTPEGIIYSKRMVEDEKRRQEWRRRQGLHRKRDVTQDVTPMSRECHDDVTPMSRECKANVTNDLTQLKGECHADVTPLSRDCHAIVTPLSRDCHADVTRRRV